MLSERLKHHVSRSGALGVGLVIVSGVFLATQYLSLMTHVPAPGKPRGPAEAVLSPGPPWVYALRADARYTIALYADLECPYCKAYLPVLKAWIDQHPQVALHWRHLPLPFHEPAATDLAIIAECAGMVGGHTAFWNMITWIFQHTLGEGRGLPDETPLPAMTPDHWECHGSHVAGEAVRIQSRQAAQDGIDATPTLKLEDRMTGKKLILSGAVEDDALLSALDLLSVE